MFVCLYVWTRKYLCCLFGQGSLCVVCLDEEVFVLPVWTRKSFMQNYNNQSSQHNYNRNSADCKMCILFDIALSGGDESLLCINY